MLASFNAMAEKDIPIYKTSVEKWWHYEASLAPLKNILKKAGIVI